MKSAHCFSVVHYFALLQWQLHMKSVFLLHTTLFCSLTTPMAALFYSSLMKSALLTALLCNSTLLINASFTLCFTCVSQLCFGLFSVHKAVICSILLMRNAPLTHAAFCHLRAFSYFLSLVFILNPKGEGRQKNKKLCCKFCIILKCSVNQWWEKWNDFTFTLISCILGAVVNTPDCVWVNAVDPELVVRLQQLSG